MGLLSFPLAAANRPERTRKRWPAPARYALRGLAVLVLFFIIAAGAGIAVIITGPTEIGFVRSRIEGILQKTVGPDYTAHVAKAVIDVDPVLGLVVEVDGVTVNDQNGTTVASAPVTRFALDPLALLTFRIEISTIEIARPELALVRSAKGELYLGDKGTTRTAGGKRPVLPPVTLSDDGGFPDLASGLAAGEAALEPAIAAAIRAGFLKLSLVGGNLTVYEAARDAERSFPNTDLEVTVDPDADRLRVALASSGYGGRWTATVERQAEKDDGSRVVSAVFSQLTLADIFPKLGDESAGGIATDIPLYGRATVHFGGGGEVSDASLRLDLGAGRITYGDAKETVLLDEATLKLRWDLDNKVIVVDPSPFYFGRTHGVITGSIRPLGDGTDRRYAFQLQAPGAILAPSDTNVPPMEAERIGVEGSIDLDAQQVMLDSAVMQVAGGSISAAGSLGYSPDGVAALAASFSPMDVSAFKQMWIPMIAPGARRWVMQHITGGRLSEGKFAAAVPTRLLAVRQKPQLTDDQLRLDLTLEDVSFTSYGEIPEVRHASGHAVLAGSTFGVDVDGAEAVAPSGGIVTISAGAFAVANVFNRPAEGDVAVQVSGDAAAIGEVANA